MNCKRCKAELPPHGISVTDKRKNFCWACDDLDAGQYRLIGQWHKAERLAALLFGLGVTAGVAAIADGNDDVWSGFADMAGVGMPSVATRTLTVLLLVRTEAEAEAEFVRGSL